MWCESVETSLSFFRSKSNSMSDGHVMQDRCGDTSSLNPECHVTRDLEIVNAISITTHTEC